MFRNADIDPFARAGYRVTGTEVPVLYATNRAAVIEWPEPVLTIFPGSTLRMGVADVRIGDGTLDWETLHRLSTSDDPDQRPIVRLDRLEQMAVLAPGDWCWPRPPARCGAIWRSAVKRSGRSSTSGL